jgi:hypothetical protein
MDALARETSALEADGEVVWSWSPDAGIKSCGTFSQGDGGNQSPVSGEITYKP